ncbi:unnamed protein product, partial [Pylaiella littoralis]
DLVYVRDSGGTRVQVIISAPKMDRRGEVTGVTFNGRCVKDAGPINGLNYVKNTEDVVKVLHAVECVRPCEGVCRRHLVEDQTLDPECARHFGSVTR